MAASRLYSVIPAGGSGTRLWPLSRSGNPKFLHALTGSPESLLQSTVERLAPLTPPQATYIVTGSAHAAAVARQLPEVPDSNLLIEPSPRDSCAAIGLAAAIIHRRDPGAIMGSFAADHLVRDGDTFVATIRAAIAGAERGYLMTVGITPNRPETGYGYLQYGPLKPGGVHEVVEFKEKPSLEVATEYVNSGRYLWNASMFVWKVSVFLDELRRQQPTLWEGLRRIADVWGTRSQDEVLGSVWPGLTKISIDHGVMEGAAARGLVATVPGTFGWTDVGDFDTLGQVLVEAEANADPAGNSVLTSDDAPPVLLADTTGTVVAAHSGRLVVTLGLRDMIVVDTPDALLVCARKSAQDIKQVVDKLRDRGDHEVL